MPYALVDLTHGPSIFGIVNDFRAARNIVKRGTNFGHYSSFRITDRQARMISIGWTKNTRSIWFPSPGVPIPSFLRL